MSVQQRFETALPGDLDPDVTLWAMAVAMFGVGDVYTTHVGLQEAGVEESNPLAERVLGMGGTAGMVAWKALVLGAAYVAYQHAPRESRTGIPLGLALLGAFVVYHNAGIIAEVSAGEH